jgi:hypothetical protein
MSRASKIFEAIKRVSRKTPSNEEAADSIHTVRFDPSRVTDAIKNDVWNNVLLLDDIDRNCAHQVYVAALRSISAGRDLSILYEALMQLNDNGITKRRAAEISHLLNNRATALMNKERQESLGIKHAIWLYSGAPCEIDPKKATGQDAAHKTANGKPFDVSKGMLLNGKWTWPGVEPGCRCASKSVIPGFS